MNIDTSALMSLFSVSPALANFQQNLLADGQMPEGFANALLAQLQQLQTSGMQGMTTGDEGKLATLQDFAAFFGKDLPVLKKVQSDIDLDDTLAALADVMRYIQPAENRSEQAAAVELSALTTEDRAVGQDNADQSIDLDPAAHAAELLAMLNRIVSQQAEQEHGAVSQTAAHVVQTADSIGATKQPPLPAVEAMPLAGAMAEVYRARQSVALRAEVLPQIAKEAVESAFTRQTVISKTDVKPESPTIDQLLKGQMWGTAPRQNAEADGSSNGGFNGSASERQAATVPSSVQQAAAAEVKTGRDSDFTKLMADISALDRSAGIERRPAEVGVLSKPILHPEWAQELGSRIVWLSKQSIPSAELQLNPKELGPISIKIDVNQDQTNVTFTTHNLAVKEAIEAALPKLRDMLGAQQMNLGDVNVSQQQSEQRAGRETLATGGQSQQQSAHKQAEGFVGATNEVLIDTLEEAEAGQVLVSQGLLSLFA